MRKAQKELLQKLIITLKQAHEEIRKAAEAGRQETAKSILEQCQQSAIRLGSAIEVSEGEGFVTIHLLEEYCELVYFLYEEINQSSMTGTSLKERKSFEKMQAGLDRVEKSVGKDIRVRTEVVFLPYKASMWDSMESIWKAADEDPDCDAYVIPIPYYDKNPDGSFRELHYEGNEYPKDVPVMSFENYDFKERRPDMIFIHNPYDEWNYVTSVHPFFYTKNLKQYTDKLIYVPYFVLDEIEPDNQEAVASMKHFCILPGVVHADKVIVQSEKMRKIYINVLTDAMGRQTRKHWQEAVLGIGSPKMDKIYTTRKEDIEIPTEWIRIIQKPDGTLKKIILYNTCVTALLKHEEKMLDKIKDTLKVFRKEQREVALLWRPHPLIKATIESMRPELWNAYEKIVEDYLEEGWGIYDDTPDMNRAIALSDAYYGDGSSLVHLYRKTGKPIMIQNVEMIIENRNE